MLVRGDLDTISGEGVHTLAMIRKYALLDIDTCPMFELIDSLVADPVDITRKIDAYLKHWFLP
jgi:hypothetical protein